MLTFVLVIFNQGTASDVFLRNNMDWLKKAKDWAQFSAVSSLGVVQKGHVERSKTVLGGYLSGNTPFIKGGALFALGLIHANDASEHASETIEYLTTALCVPRMHDLCTLAIAQHARQD